jgi:hypothetical protein
MSKSTSSSSLASSTSASDTLSNTGLGNLPDLASLTANQKKIAQEILDAQKKLLQLQKRRAPKSSSSTSLTTALAASMQFVNDAVQDLDSSSSEAPAAFGLSHQYPKADRETLEFFQRIRTDPQQLAAELAYFQDLKKAAQRIVGKSSKSK